MKIKKYIIIGLFLLLGSLFVIGGNIIVQEGALEVEQDLDVTGNINVAGNMKQQRVTYRSVPAAIGGYPDSRTWDLFNVDQNGGFIIEWISGYPSNSYYYYKRWFAKTGSVGTGNLQSVVLEAVGSAPGLVLELSVVGGKVRLTATITNSNNVWGTPQGTIAVRALYGEL